MDAASFREWRVSNQYTAKELALELGISEMTIGRWEREETKPMWRLIELACKGLLFSHSKTCRCPNRNCGHMPDRYGKNGHSYDPH